MTKEPLFILGGTFNPPHLGHIHTALDTIRVCGVEQTARIGLMPANTPPHKTIGNVKAEFRLHMVDLVCRKYPSFYLEDIEFQLPSPSYSVNTLAALREREGDRPICFIIGDDSLYNIESWYQWQRLTDLCHLVVMRRQTPIPTASESLKSWLNQHQTSNPQALFSVPSGKLFRAGVKLQNISSTELRQAIQQKASKKLLSWLDEDVLQYIVKQKLYF